MSAQQEALCLNLMGGITEMETEELIGSKSVMVSVREHGLSQLLPALRILLYRILYHFWECEYCTISHILSFYIVQVISQNTQREQ